MTLTAAWLQAFPSTRAKRKNMPILARRACELFEKKRKNEADALIEEYGLGLTRIIQEIHKGLTQKRVIVYQGKIMKDERGNPIEIEDNAIQQRMREALI
jgi:hypothetical protein